MSPTIEVSDSFDKKPISEVRFSLQPGTNSRIVLKSQKMKTLSKNLRACLFVLTGIAMMASVTGCEEEPGFAGAGPSFDIDLFEQNIKDALEDQSVGFAYAINQNGWLQRESGFGKARTSADGNANMTAHTPINVASISKTITTVAALRALEDNPDVDLDDAVAPYLPLTWELGPGMDEVTFRELLSHTSGIEFSGGQEDQSYVSLRDVVEEGVTGAKTYKYSNVGISLFRILIPNIQDEFSAPVDISQADRFAYIYRSYVMNKVFGPMDLTEAYLNEPDDAAFLYAFPDDGTRGIRTGNWTLTAAAGGWYLSAHELARFLAHLRYNDAILSPESRAIMDEENLGWTETLDGDHGTYHAKGGALNYDNPIKGVRTIIINFPYGVQASVVVNSTEGQGYNLHAILRDAYDDAWH